MTNFKEGDLVRHRASGELAIFIEYGLNTCKKHKDDPMICIFGMGSKCEREEDKSFCILSRNLEGRRFRVPTIEIEKAPEDQEVK